MSSEANPKQKPATAVGVIGQNPVTAAASQKIANKANRGKINVTLAKIGMLQHFMKFGRLKNRQRDPNKPKGSKYQPHQGAKECVRRRRQMANGMRVNSKE